MKRHCQNQDQDKHRVGGRVMGGAHVVGDGVGQVVAR